MVHIWIAVALLEILCERDLLRKQRIGCTVVQVIIMLIEKG